MIGSSCNERNCPGWVPALAAGALMVLLVTFSAIGDALADVRVEIDRDFPDGSSETVVRQFNDNVEFEMWMENRLEQEGCDPYASHIRIFLR
jgi:hypothetical protein